MSFLPVFLLVLIPYTTHSSNAQRLWNANTYSNRINGTQSSPRPPTTDSDPTTRRNITVSSSIPPPPTTTDDNGTNWETTNTTQSSIPPPPPPTTTATNPTISGNTTTQSDSSPPTRVSKNNAGLIAEVIVVPLVIVIVFSVLVYFCWRWRKYKCNDDTSEVPAAKFSYEELASSTQKFADSKKLAPDGSGAFYKGFLNDLHKTVAVKRVYNTSIQDIKKYSSEIKIISRPTHPNLVPLIGWCHEEQELLLIYEFFENGSLDLHLFGRDNLLTWNTRYIIARGLASALICLQDEWEHCVLHRDIKSSNVMLDSNLKARLGDYGFAKLVNNENNMIAGTLGYIAPEYLATRKASKGSDVYSFGVVALEIASGRSAIDIHGHGETNLVKWVWDRYGTGKLLEAADPRLNSNFAEEEMKCLLTVGLWCAHPDSKHRPSMKRAFQVLNFEASLPQLPPNILI